MIEFFRKLFAPETSGATARERLRLVLLSDHLSLAPEVVTALRADLIAVISKYVEVDEANCDVSFEQQDRAVAVLANIPIVALRGRTPPAAPPAPPPPRTPEPPPMGDAIGAAFAVAQPLEAVSVPAVSGGDGAPRTVPKHATGAPRRRRRRRRPAQNPAHATA
jgi:cell division topological specificity factor